MSVFVVIFGKNQVLDEEKLASVSSQKPYKINDTSFLVTSDELTSDVSEELGMNDDQAVEGVVLSLNGARAGWFSVAVWEWLNKAQKNK